MSGQISDEKIDQVRERSDIVEVISRYVSLKGSGRNHLGLCPFHAEKTPSFSVNAQRQFFHCFGCGAGGDVFSFLMQAEGISFPDAVRRLAGQAGVDLEERQLSESERVRLEQRERLFRINQLAADYFHQNLMSHAQAEGARNYMKERGYGRKTASDYLIGYALEGWSGLRDHLLRQDIAAEDARLLGLVREGKQGHGDYDMFRGRLIFPIFDLAGRIVAFAGRVLDDSKPKYINSPESLVYHKGTVLFGLYQARQAMRLSGDVLVVEGYFDQMALQRAGFPQVVATCGTALTVDHVQQLKRYVQRVVLVFDQDQAGRQATFKAMTVLQQEGVPAVALTLPGGEDPDSFVRRCGAEGFQRCLDAARPIMELFMEETLTEAGTGVELKVRAVERILERIAALKSELEQDLYLKELSRRSGIEVRLLQQKMARTGRREERGAAPAPPEPPPPQHEPPAPDGLAVARGARRRDAAPREVGVSRTEKILLRLLMQGSAMADRFIAGGGPELLENPEVAALAELVLERSSASGCEIGELLPHASATQVEILNSLASCDPGEFNENPEQAVADCLRALEKLVLKKRIDLLWQELIPAAEGAGDAALADQHRAELSRLQSRVKGSSRETKISG